MTLLWELHACTGFCFQLSMNDLMTSPPLVNFVNGRRQPPKITYTVNNGKRRKIAENVVHESNKDEHPQQRRLQERMSSENEKDTQCSLEKETKPHPLSPRVILAEIPLSSLSTSPLSIKRDASPTPASPTSPKSGDCSSLQSTEKGTAPTTSSTPPLVLSPCSPKRPLSLKPTTSRLITSYFSPFITTSKPLFRACSKRAKSSTSPTSSNDVVSSCKIIPRKEKEKTLNQMILDLGQSPRTTCSLCKMSYAPGSPEDDEIHKKFHAKNVGGINFNYKAFGNRLKVIWEETGGGGGSGGPNSDRRLHESTSTRAIILITRKSSTQIKRKIREILEVADAELGSAEIPDDILWSQIKAETGERNSLLDSEHGDNNNLLSDRYKLYLYILNKKCVGALLAERISKACLFPSSSSTESSSKPALLGVSRIWTSSSYRRTGIATQLLDCARNSFVYGMVIDKRFVAFSQTTTAGKLLAEAWFRDPKADQDGEKVKWCVYVEK